MQELLREKDAEIAKLKHVLTENVFQLGKYKESSWKYLTEAERYRRDLFGLQAQLEKADALAKIGEEAARLLNWDDFNQALKEYLGVRNG